MDKEALHAACHPPGEAERARTNNGQKPFLQSQRTVYV
jgi:hypothetical protein